MYVLGIDTSCDDTSFAIIEEDKKVIKSTVFNQSSLHAIFGGVVPEIASRKHVEIIEPLFLNFLESSGLSLKDVDLIGVTSGPGLIGSILVGLCFAKGLSLASGIPILGVNHVEAHAMSVFLTRKIDFPFISLVVSGGHTVLFLMEDYGEYRILGSTRDDAAGEALDKASKFLGLGYPGGVAIEKLSYGSKTDFVNFPRPMIDEDNFDFSFSGLKTALVNYVKKNPIRPEDLRHVVASYQEAVFEVLIEKTLKACKTFSVGRVSVGGGVAANSRLRESFLTRAMEEKIEVFFPDKEYCTDNAAMVAITAYYLYTIKGQKSPIDLKAFSRMKLRE